MIEHLCANSSSFTSSVLVPTPFLSILFSVIITLFSVKIEDQDHTYIYIYIYIYSYYLSFIFPFVGKIREEKPL